MADPTKRPQKPMFRNSGMTPPVALPRWIMNAKGITPERDFLTHVTDYAQEVEKTVKQLQALRNRLEEGSPSTEKDTRAATVIMQDAAALVVKADEIWAEKKSLGNIDGNNKYAVSAQEGVATLSNALLSLGEQLIPLYTIEHDAQHASTIQAFFAHAPYKQASDNPEYEGFTNAMINAHEGIDTFARYYPAELGRAIRALRTYDTAEAAPEGLTASPPSQPSVDTILPKGAAANVLTHLEVAQSKLGAMMPSAQIDSAQEEAELHARLNQLLDNFKETNTSISEVIYSLSKESRSAEEQLESQTLLLSFTEKAELLIRDLTDLWSHPEVYDYLQNESPDDHMLGALSLHANLISDYLNELRVHLNLNEEGFAERIFGENYKANQNYTLCKEDIENALYNITILATGFEVPEFLRNVDGAENIPLHTPFPGIEEPTSATLANQDVADDYIIPSDAEDLAIPHPKQEILDAIHAGSVVEKGPLTRD